MHLTKPFRAALTNILASTGDTSEIWEVAPLDGGCIHQVVRLKTNNKTYCLKWNDAPLPGMFSTEAEGLSLLETTHTVHIPQVIGVNDPGSEQVPSFILLEYIDPPSNQTDGWSQEQLGEDLARLHLATQPSMMRSYGLDADNYLGASPQMNGWNDDWITFFGEKRIAFQMELARQKGRLPPIREARLCKFIARLPSWLAGVQRKPALLHGDLWAGNIIPNAQHRPVLIDPAVYYGDREAEIAYTECFGGFSSRFYQAYHAHYPLDPGYQDRRNIYNLYHLLNHLNIFGETYGAQVDAILRYYVGE